MPVRKPLALAALLGLTLAGPAAAGDYAHFESLWLAPALPAGAAPDAQAVPALLNLPPAWSPGDAGVILVADGPMADPSLAGLTAALLDEGAAVLELDVGTAYGPDPKDAAPGLLPELYGALLALRREAGAGLVVALGHGAAGEAALLASAETQAARHLGEAGPRLVAAAALGPGPARFAAGAAPAEAEAWPLRAMRLCRLLAGPGTAPQPGMLGECAAALLTRPGRAPWRRGSPDRQGARPGPAARRPRRLTRPLPPPHKPSMLCRVAPSRITGPALG